MSRRGEGNIFVGRLNKNTRTRDLEDIFESYGRMIRCDIKYGVDTAKMGGRGNHESRDTTYAFIDFEDRKDAEDAIKYENGREICGNSIVVEWAKGSQRRSTTGYDECYKCHRVGHWARDCPEDWQSGGGGGGGYRGGGRARSRSPRRRRSYRSRSRDRRRSRSHSRDRHRRSRSRSKSPRRQRSRSASPAKNRSRSRSYTRSRTGSPAANGKDAN